MKKQLLLGAHMSIAGGLQNAIIHGESIQCTAIQIFTKNNRQWFAKEFTTEEIEQFLDAMKKSSIAIVVAHACYLINLGSPNKDVYEKSKKALLVELNRCEQLGIPYLIVHPGSHLKSSVADSLKKIVEALNGIFDEYKGPVQLLLENSAGQGTSICHTFEQIATIRSLASHKKKIGVCFDTCHAFAAGYKFDTTKNYEAMWNNFDDIIGLSHLKVIHLSDSKKNLGSHVDRHEDIGKGKIGLEGFRHIINDKHFFDIPKILETPRNDLNDYVKNMAILKSLISEKNKKLFL